MSSTAGGRSGHKARKASQIKAITKGRESHEFMGYYIVYTGDGAWSVFDESGVDTNQRFISVKEAKRAIRDGVFV